MQHQRQGSGDMGRGRGRAAESAVARARAGRRRSTAVSRQVGLDQAHLRTVLEGVVLVRERHGVRVVGIGIRANVLPRRRTE